MASARLVIRNSSNVITFDSAVMTTPIVLLDANTGTAAGSITVSPYAGGTLTVAQSFTGGANTQPAKVTVSGSTVSWTAGASVRLLLIVT